MASRPLPIVVSMLVGVAGAVAACGGDESSGVGSIEEGLRSLPLGAHDEARGESGTVQIEIADIAAVAELRSLDGPEAGRDADEIVDQFVELFAFGADRPAVDVLSTELSTSLLRAPESYEEELGIDLGAVTSMAAVTGTTASFQVFTGDLSLAPSLIDLRNGVRTTRDDDDDSVDPDARGVDLLGRPIRVAERDDAIAVSTREALVAEWADDGSESLAEEDEVLRAAQALDEVGAVSALIVSSDFSLRPPPFASEEAIERYLDAAEGAGVVDERFDVVGLGAGEVDGEVVMIVAYVFDDEDDAAGAVDTIDDIWSGVELLTAPGREVDEFVEVVSVDRAGEVVIVVAEPLELPSLRLAAGFVSQGEFLFRHG